MLCMSRLEEAVNDADLILECVVEDLEIKKDLLESRFCNKLYGCALQILLV